MLGESAGRPRRRFYDSALRREQARATRDQIAAAARRLFAERGWAGTRVRDVAQEAGVAEATVYAAYANKAGLARALVDAVERSADVLAAPHNLPSGDPARQLAALVESDRRLFEHGGDLIALLRDGGRSEPDLLAAYREGRSHGDQLRRATFETWPPEAMRNDVTIEAAVDTFAALCNIDVYRELTQERGWTPDAIQAWWTTTLTVTLLPPPRPQSPHSDSS